MKVVTFINEKGGVGKTTNAVTLASGLAIKGYRVMLLDADPQGHAGLSLGFEKSRGFYDLVISGMGWMDVVVEVPPERYQLPDAASDVKGNLFLVRSDIHTQSIPMSLANHTDGNYVLLDLIAELVGEEEDVVDYVIIDTSPTPSGVHQIIYMASDAVIYPAKMSMLSLDGLQESLKRLSAANRARRGEGLPEIQMHGVLPTMTRLHTIEHSSRIEQVIEAFGRHAVYSPMTNRTAWERAVTAQKSIFAAEPFDSASNNAWRFVNEFLMREGVKNESK